MDPLLRAALVGMVAEHDDNDDDRDALSVEQKIGKILEAVSNMDTAQDFGVGDFVEFKPGLTVAKAPSPKNPCMVIGFLDKPMTSKRDGGDGGHAAHQRTCLVAGIADAEWVGTWALDPRFLRKCPEHTEIADRLRSQPAA